MAEIAKHLKRTPELSVLTDPYYVRYIINLKNPDARELRLKEEFQRLITQFDLMKLKTECQNCTSPARFLAYMKGSFFYDLWCGDCSPYWIEHLRGSMDIFSGYMSALDYAEYYFPGDRFLARAIIRNLARLKGMPMKVNARRAKIFFRGEVL
ncbi:MAG: hypothetical protein ACM3P0_01140 [Acidobacteriota bacterium]